MSGEQVGRAWALLVLAGVALAGCGASTAPTAAGVSSSSVAEVLPAGDIPDSQVYVPISIGRFTVSVPQGWARSAEGTTTVFTDKFNSVRIDQTPRATAGDVATARAQDVPVLQKTVTAFALSDVRSVSRPAGVAVLITYAADSVANAVTGKSVREAVERYAFWHAGQEVVLTLSAPAGSDNVDPWRTITESLRWQS